MTRRLVFNRGTAQMRAVLNVARLREETLDGRKYLVAPTTLIVSGVLRGSKGALYYPENELKRDPAIWDGVPLTLGHPSDNGRAVSARNPAIQERFGVGNVYNVNWDDGRKRLRGEAWVDIAKAQKLRSNLLNALRSGGKVEVSTGLFTDNTPAPAGAAYNGRAYDHVARDYKADHLALLLDSKGACSVEDGCGLNVNQAGETIEILDRLPKDFIHNMKPGDHFERVAVGTELKYKVTRAQQTENANPQGCNQYGCKRGAGKSEGISRGESSGSTGQAGLPATKAAVSAARKDGFKVTVSASGIEVVPRSVKVAPPSGRKWGDGSTGPKLLPEVDKRAFIKPASRGGKVVMTIIHEDRGGYATTSTHSDQAAAIKAAQTYLYKPTAWHFKSASKRAERPTGNQAQASFDDLRKALRRELTTQFGQVEIVDVFPKSVVYSRLSYGPQEADTVPRLYEVGYSADKRGKVTLDDGGAKEVQRMTTYETVSNVSQLVETLNGGNNHGCNQYGCKKGMGSAKKPSGSKAKVIKSTPPSTSSTADPRIYSVSLADARGMYGGIEAQRPGAAVRVGDSKYTRAHGSRTGTPVVGKTGKIVSSGFDMVDVLLDGEKLPRSFSKTDLYLTRNQDGRHVSQLVETLNGGNNHGCNQYGCKKGAGKQAVRVGKGRVAKQKITHADKFQTYIGKKGTTTEAKVKSDYNYQVAEGGMNQAYSSFRKLYLKANYDYELADNQSTQKATTNQDGRHVGPSVFNQEEEPDMAHEPLTNEEKKQLIEALVTNDNGFEEDDREWLGEQDDDRLRALAETAAERKVLNERVAELEEQVTNKKGAKNGKGMPPWLKKKIDEKDEEGDEEDMEENEDDMEENNCAGKKKMTKNACGCKDNDDEAEDDEEVEPMTENEWLEQAPAGVRAVVERAMRAETNHKQGLVRQITANKRCKFTKEFLLNKSTDELEVLAELATENKRQAAPAFLGMGAPMVQVTNAGPPMDEPLGLPEPDYVAFAASR